MVVTDLWFNKRMMSGTGIMPKHPHMKAMKAAMKIGEKLEDPLPELLTGLYIFIRIPQMYSLMQCVRLTELSFFELHTFLIF